MKSFMGALIVLFALLIGVASMAGGIEADSDASQPSVTKASKRTTEMGYIAKAGTIEWVVFDAKKYDTLYKSIYGSPPVSTSGKFVRVAFRVENVGSTAVNLGPIGLMDDKGRIFEEYSRAFEYVYQGQHCLYVNLNPGVPHECDTIFEVARDARNLVFVGTDLKYDPQRLAVISLGF